MSNIIRSKINLSDLQQGMTVETNEGILTVSKNDIKYNRLFGYSFRGDGSKKVITRIEYLVPTAFGIQKR